MNTFQVINKESKAVLFESENYLACEMAMNDHSWYWNKHKIVPELPSKFEGYLITDGCLTYIKNCSVSIEKIKRVGESELFTIRTSSEEEFVHVFNYLKQNKLTLKINRDYKGLVLDVYHSDMLCIVEDLHKEKVVSPYIDAN